jgi:hypothetical protein
MIANAMRIRAKRLTLKSEHVIQGIHDVINRARLAGDLGTQLRAWAKLGEHIGMFKQRIEHAGSVRESPEVNAISKLEVARRIAFVLNQAALEQERQPPTEEHRR